MSVICGRCVGAAVGLVTPVWCVGREHGVLHIQKYGKEGCRVWCFSEKGNRIL